MRHLTILAATALILSGSAVFAQSSSNGSVRVQPGHFCANNKCVRFSPDLMSVSIQGRQAVSVASYGLRSNPTISASQYSTIFKLALRQNGVNGTRG